MLTLFEAKWSREEAELARGGPQHCEHLLYVVIHKASVSAVHFFGMSIVSTFSWFILLCLGFVWQPREVIVILNKVRLKMQSF